MGTMEESELPTPVHDLSQKTVMYLGLFASSVCCILGYPCSDDANVIAGFRATCVGYFLCNLIGLLLGKGPLSDMILRMGLLINSLSSWLVSAHWCVGFGEWFILMLAEHAFMAFGTMVLVETAVQKHVLFTMAGSSVCYLARRPATVAIAADVGKLWAAGTVSVVLVLVGGIWYSGHGSMNFLQRKIELVSSILTMSQEELSSSEPLTRSPLTSKIGGQAPKAASDGNIEGLQLLHCIGEGSFGKVYSATYREQRAAVKIMSWEGEKLKRIDPVKEAKLCVQIAHPNLVKAFDFFLRDCESEASLKGCKRSWHEIWIVQEWCDCGTLCSYCDCPRLDEQGLRQTKSIMLDICRACEYLHLHEIIHGDLTSNNVLLQTRAVQDKQELDFVCKICDFGLARVLEEGVSTLLTSQLGTVSHMPPELLQMENRRLTKRADVYAVGIILYQVLLGTLPYAGKTAPQIIISVSRGQRLRLKEEVPEDVRRLFCDCTETAPEARPEAADLVRRLTSLSY